MAAFIPLAAAGINAIGGAAKGAPAGPSRADQQASVNLGFDSSGFTVSTGSSKANGASYGGSIPWLWIIGGAAVLLLIWKRK